VCSCHRLWKSAGVCNTSLGGFFNGGGKCLPRAVAGRPGVPGFLGRDFTRPRNNSRSPDGMRRFILGGWVDGFSGGGATAGMACLVAARCWLTCHATGRSGKKPRAAIGRQSCAAGAGRVFRSEPSAGKGGKWMARKTLMLPGNEHT